MLLDDLRMYALPYGSDGEEGFTVQVEPNDDALVSLLTNALPVRNYRHRQLSRALRDFVETALWHLAHGSLYLRIEYFRPTEPPAAAPIAFRLEVLRAEFVHRHLGKLYYWIPVQQPGESAAQWSREPLDHQSVVVVTMPRKLRQTMNRTLEVVRASDQDLNVMHEFTIGRYAANSGFDLASYKRRSSDIVLRATRDAGWSGRGLFTEGLLDPMKVWRAIQFARFVVKLRDIALLALQTAVDRAGERIGFNARIKLAGVLTEADLDRLEADLQAGTRPISEMFTPKVPK